MASARSCCCTPAARPVPAPRWNVWPTILTLPFYIITPTSTPPEEYHRREAELERFVRDAGYAARGITVVELPYDPQEFYTAVKGLEKKSRRTAHAATVALPDSAGTAPPTMPPHTALTAGLRTTLSISPMKDPIRLNDHRHRTAASSMACRPCKASSAKRTATNAVYS